jgi:hypothetical protein
VTFPLPRNRPHWIPVWMSDRPGPTGYKLKRQQAIEKAVKAPKEKQLGALMKIIRAEVLDCDAHFKPFHSAHEAYGVMLEEFDELWDEIKKNQSGRDYPAMAKEAVQVAAMAIRLLRDVCCDANRGHEKLRPMMSRAQKALATRRSRELHGALAGITTKMMAAIEGRAPKRHKKPSTYLQRAFMKRRKRSRS